MEFPVEARWYPPSNALDGGAYLLGREAGQR